MVDTICFVGNPIHARWDFDLEKYTAWKRKDGTEVLTEVLYKKTDNYRVFYSPSYNRARVECNLGKILFKKNIFNYEKNSNILNLLCRRLGDFFFQPHSYYISRCDIGAVRVFADNLAAARVIEGFRNARPEGSRLTKFKHQNYADSVFYYTKNWSIKVYNKGAEMRKNKEDTTEADDRTIRFEKTYRTGEFERLGMQKTPTYGVHIDSFDIAHLVDDFFNVFTKWEQKQAGTIVRGKGVLGCLAILDNLGHIDDAVANGVVSRSSLSRYNRIKSKTVDLLHSDRTIKFDNNLPPEFKNRLDYVRNFGFNSILS